MEENIFYRSRAPLRLGLAGGGTDVDPFARIYGGAVLNVTINMYASCSLKERNDGKIKLVSIDFNQTVTLEAKKELELVEGFELAIGAYNYLVNKYNLVPFSFELHTSCDAPVGSGLGSSSAILVAILAVLRFFLQKEVSPKMLADEAYYVERIILGFNGGKQDQYSASLGGWNFMEFNESNVQIENLQLTDCITSELENSSVIIYMGASRDSSVIISNQRANVTSRDSDSIQAMKNVKNLAFNLREALLNSELKIVHEIFNKGWEQKKLMSSKISNEKIEELISKSFKYGALTGKISGAGGGGFAYFLVDFERKKDFIENMSNFYGIIKQVTFTSKGVQTWKVKI